MLQPFDILDQSSFSEKRAEILSEIIALKKLRRVFLGPDITVLFENRRLIWWQVQEMLRIEKAGPTQIQDELDVYNPLMPDSHHLSMMVMLELSNAIERPRALQELQHIEDHFQLCLGTEIIKAQPLSAGLDETERPKTSSVHFMKIALNDAQKECFMEIQPLLRCQHPQQKHQVLLSMNLWQQLRQELKQGY